MKRVRKMPESEVSTDASTMSMRQLWKHALKAGKAAELLEEINADAEGRKVLDASRPPAMPVVNVLHIGPDSAMDNTFVVVPWTRVPPSMRLLITNRVDRTLPSPGVQKYGMRTSMGGISIEWEDKECAIEWCQKITQGMDGNELKQLYEELEIEVEEDDDDDDEDDDDDDDDEDDDKGDDCGIKKYEAWRDNNMDKLCEVMEDKILYFFEDTSLIENALEFNIIGLSTTCATIAKATIVIDASNWS